MKIRGESVLNLILLIFGLAIMALALQMGFGSLKRPGSGLFPFFCGLIIFLANAILLRRKSQWSPSLFSSQEMKRFIWMTAPIILWVLLMPFLGYVFMTFLSTLFLSKILRLEGWRKPLILSLGTTGLSYVLFGYYLYLDLPRGILSF
jgi:putative tricarboxylic transport membrane protein